MKNIQNKLIVLLIIVATLPSLVYAQDSFSSELSYEINRVFLPLSITNNNLNEAQTLADLNNYYRASWVKEFYAVEILTLHNGKIKKTVGENDIITQEQKANMNLADAGSDISVKVHYLPENNLKNNEPREMNFSFKVAPSEAKFNGGQQQMITYLKNNAIDKIAIDDFQKHSYNLAAIKFTVTEEGKIINPHVVESSKNKDVDALLVKTISNMPNWNPSEYPNGTKVKQDYILTVGDHNSCVVNVLNIKRK